MASAEYHRQYRAKNRERLRAKWREYYRNSGGRYLAASNARNAKNRDAVNARLRKAVHKKAGIEATRPMPTVCECCGKKPKKGALCLDHDHLTDEFRGWLCGACNRSIGQLGDTLAGVINAVLYLQRYLQSRTK
jgi:hypothetical protein